jgi:hypothetical protein
MGELKGTCWAGIKAFSRKTVHNLQLCSPKSHNSLHARGGFRKSLILKGKIYVPNFRAGPKKPYGSSTLRILAQFVHKVIHRIWGWRQ